jgi:hypothetical protein
MSRATAPRSRIVPSVPFLSISLYISLSRLFIPNVDFCNFADSSKIQTNKFHAQAARSRRTAAEARVWAAKVELERAEVREACY